MQKPDEDQSVSDLVSSDSSVFREFYSHYFRRLPSFITRIFPHLKNDALDLTQDTMLKMHKNVERWRGWNPAQIDSYVRRAAFRLASNLSRNKVRNGEISIEDILAAIEDPNTPNRPTGIKVNKDLARLIIGESNERRLNAMRVKSALKRLNTKDRNIILQIDMLGLTPQELSTSKRFVDAVYKRHQRARKRFIAFYRCAKVQEV